MAEEAKATTEPLPADVKEVAGMIGSVLNYLTTKEEAGTEPGMVATALVGVILAWIDTHTPTGEELAALEYFMRRLEKSAVWTYGPKKTAPGVETIQ